MNNSASSSGSHGDSEVSGVVSKKRKVDHMVDGSIVKVVLKNFMWVGLILKICKNVNLGSYDLILLRY